jgi:hypothetical protein
MADHQTIFKARQYGRLPRGGLYGKRVTIDELVDLLAETAEQMRWPSPRVRRKMTSPEFPYRKCHPGRPWTS